MQNNKYIYTFNYNDTEVELCKLESFYLFGHSEEGKLLFSDKKIEPSVSAYIKKRLDIQVCSEDYSALISEIKALDIHTDRYKVEYLEFDSETSSYQERLQWLRDVGNSIEGSFDLKTPKTTFGVCQFEGAWYFGELIKDDFEWHKHKNKPNSFSHSLNVSIGKAMLNMATNGDKSKTLIDACCGVGTVLLEACFVGYNIEGCDINWKVCKQSRANLEHFGYETTVYRSDINDLEKQYDAAIVDLPYNILSHVDEDALLGIVKGARKAANRIVIVSTTDITSLIERADLKLLDTVHIRKSRSANITRRVWVCER